MLVTNIYRYTVLFFFTAVYFETRNLEVGVVLLIVKPFDRFIKICTYFLRLLV